ncbi:MAG: M48 family metalloprotease [Devosia sp.]
MTTPSQGRVIPSQRGREHVKLIGNYGGVYSNPRVEAAVARLVGRLVEASDEPNRSFRVTILNSPAVNAFALPSGDVYVTRGLIGLANDESELAAVIAHEIAHVTANHAALRQRQAQAAALAKRVSEVVSDPVIAADTRETAELSLAAFSQQQELEADKIGVKTLAGAGFDPFAASRFLESMARHADLPTLNAASADKPGFLSSHPSTPARVENAKRVARGYGAPGLGRQARNQYLRSLDGLLYGDDPREGFVRGREFGHVELGIAFTVPKGYVLKNTSAAVLATDGDQTAVRFDAVPVTNQSLGDYLRSGWVKGLVVDSVREEKVRGLDVATASALVEGWSFRIAAIRGPNRIYRFIFASSRPASAYEAAFRRTVDSFRLLSPSQRAGMRPLRMRVVSVRPNETVDTLAARMQGVDNRVKKELFEVINGVGPDRPLVPGDLVKLITE